MSGASGSAGASDSGSAPIALVTGAARPRGIGRTTALMLADRGYDVACLDIARPLEFAPAHAVASADDLDSVVEEIRSKGRRAVALRADVSDEAAVEKAVASASTELGVITAVANCAGGSGPGFGLGPLMVVPGDEFRKVLEVNLLGTWFVARACASRMVAAGVTGSIVNVSSQAGKRPFPMLGPYCAAKSAVISITQTLAVELGPSGINVNAVCPGTVDTDLINPNGMFEVLLGGPEGVASYLEREIPLRRVQTAAEIAEVMCWLLSDAGRAVTGEAVNASAGQTVT